MTAHHGTPQQNADRVFLTARWTDVLLVNCRVSPSLLQPYVPSGSTLDTPDAEPDAHLLSMIVFRFQDTRVREMRVPTAQDFAELNLRFYVRDNDRRAAVFLREFVPAPLVILGARLFYRQPYYPARISHTVTRQDAEIRVQTRFRNHAHRGTIDVTARNTPRVPDEASVEHFIKEHYWGFHQDRRGGSFAYRVDHPIWTTYPVEQATMTIDPGALLGGAWRSVNWHEARHSVVFADGSDARVFAPVPLASETGKGSPR
jgi:uncharacterized protein